MFISVTWARDASTSLLLNEEDARKALQEAGCSSRSSGAATSRSRSNGSRQPWPAPAERSEPRHNDGCGFSGEDQQSGPQPLENRLRVLSGILSRD